MIAACCAIIITGVQEEDLDKLQTGGPDGDLGSNEIKISKDRTIGASRGRTPQGISPAWGG